MPVQKGASRLSICNSESTFSNLEDHPSYLKLPNGGSVEVLHPNIDALGHKIAAVDMFLFHRPFSFIESRHFLLFQLPGLPLCLVLPSVFQCGCILFSASANAEEGEIGSTPSPWASCERRSGRLLGRG